LSKIKSPIRPLALPYHAEILAQAFVDAPSPAPSPVKFRFPLDVEKYLDLSAEVHGMVLSSDNEQGWIEAPSDDSMSP